MAATVSCLLLASCGMLSQSADTGDAAPTWTGTGLVLVACGAEGFGPSTVELWELDPVTGARTGHRPAVELPDGVRLAYGCDAPGALVRRLFNHDFSAVAVQVRDDDSAAAQVGVLDLTNGRVRVRSQPTASAFSALPDDGYALYDEAGRVLWYRSGEDALVSFDPDAPSESAWVEHAVADSVAAVDDPDAIWWYYARAQVLPDPSGQVAVADDTLYVPAQGRQVTMFCTELFSGEPIVDGDCIASDSTTGGVPNLTPAAWVDEDTLLAFDGPVSGGAANTVVRLELDAGYEAVSASPTLPPSDWLHRSLVVSQTCQRFATFARRGDDLAVFSQDLYADPAQLPATVTVFDRDSSEAPDDAPTADARLIDWVAADEGAAACAP